MKKHDEDFWDFRSDPMFSNNKNSSEASKSSKDFDPSIAQPAEQPQDYINILQTSAQKSSLDELDNMTLVMNDDQAAFVEAKKNTTASKKTAEEKQKTEAENTSSPKSSETAQKEETKNEPLPKKKTRSSKKSAAEKKPQPAENVVPPEVAAFDLFSKTAKAEAEEVIEKIEEPAPAPEKTAEQKPATDKSTEKNIETSADIEPNPTRRGSTARQSSAETDDDFVFAKPYSVKKKKSHHSHSETPHQNELPTDNVDDYVFARYRKQKGSHHHHSKAKNAEYTHIEGNETIPVVCSTTSAHFRAKDSRRKKERKKKERKWKNRPWWQKLLIILAFVFGILLILAIIAVVLFLIFSRIGLKQATNYDGAVLTAPTIESVDVKLENEGKTVYYNNKEYKLNTDIANILCIGVDKHNINETYEYDGYEYLENNGQADAIYMVALNTETGKTTVISVPRDTMADVAVYDKNGKYQKTDYLQICQSYAFGDGKQSSCENTKSSVSRLFYQLPIQTYFAMDLSAIAPINDTVGGVTLSMIDNSFYDVNLVQHFKGETLTLYGDNARKYVQHRDVNYLESTTNRLARQIHYLQAFTSKTLSMTKKDITTPVTLYNVVSSNSISNIDVYRISAFARCLIENGVSSLDFKTLPGKLTSDGKYAQYIVDEQAFYELFLETYYVPVN